MSLRILVPPCGVSFEGGPFHVYKSTLGEIIGERVVLCNGREFNVYNVPDSQQRIRNYKSIIDWCPECLRFKIVLELGE